jgi:hypothetical protein
MSSTKSLAKTTLGPQEPDSPVRVRLRRLHASSAKAFPPLGDETMWWARLKMALGTQSSDFVNASLAQLIAAARLPGGGICPVAMNAALAFIEGQKPKDEVDAAIAMQMACAHGASMMLLARFGGGGGGDRRVQPLAQAIARLMNAFSNAAETLRKRQNGSSQYMRIEHVHVGDGGQAVIGNVQRGKPGGE